MSGRRLRAPGPLGLILALAATAPADTVTTVPDASGKVRKIVGTVQSESPTEVLVGAQKVPVPEIDSIDYDGSPPSMTVAKSRQSAGNLSEAASEYQKAADAASAKPFIAQAATFNRLQILAQTSPAEAISGIDAFVKANPRCRELGPALELQIRLLLDKQQYERADGAATTLRDRVAWAKDHAEVTKAHILTLRGKPADAASALEKLMVGAPASSPKGREARLALAEALAAEKKFPEAEKAAREALQAAGAEDYAARAPAYNTLGDVLRAAGRPKDALLSYLHTDLLFAHDKDEHARALAHIAQLWRELKRDDRADEALDRLKQEYPGSPWLASAGK